MPELPEVEVLVRHLRRRLPGKTIRSVSVRRPRVIRPTSAAQLQRALRGATFTRITRRGKYLVFELARAGDSARRTLVGHLGMTGRMYLLPRAAPLPKHAAVVLDLGRRRFVYEDARYFGRFTLETALMATLGPEPLERSFSVSTFARTLRRFRQPIKVKLLDQSVVAGVGNIYASEALFRARLAPQRPANRLARAEIQRLHRAIQKVLSEAIRFGSTIPLNHGGRKSDGLFYFGKADDASDYYVERLRVYDREGQPCPRCGTPIRRIVQAARGTFYCPKCQARP